MYACMHIYIYIYIYIYIELYVLNFSPPNYLASEYWILCCRTFPMDMSNCETKVHTAGTL